jgi:hypothetical protein
MKTFHVLYWQTDYSSKGFDVEAQNIAEAYKLATLNKWLDPNKIIYVMVKNLSN